MTLVVMGLVCFYITYVSYRNLKSFLPFVMGEEKYDRELHLIDRALFFGHEPATILHQVFGTGWTAHVLSRSTCGSCRWSRWRSPPGWCGRATSPSATGSPPPSAWPGRSGPLPTTRCPTLGPGFRYSWLYSDLPDTGSGALMDSLFYARKGVLRDGIEGAVQSVAGFASLHVAITLLVALMVQYTLRNRVMHWIFWINFAITVVATLYFGWHYVADDIAGVAIALFSFWLGGLASGQKFDRGGLASHPTTTTSQVPVDAD